MALTAWRGEERTRVTGMRPLIAQCPCEVNARWPWSSRRRQQRSTVRGSRFVLRCLGSARERPTRAPMSPGDAKREDGRRTPSSKARPSLSEAPPRPSSPAISCLDRQGAEGIATATLQQSSGDATSSLRARPAVSERGIGPFDAAGPTWPMGDLPGGAARRGLRRSTLRGLGQGASATPGPKRSGAVLGSCVDSSAIPSLKRKGGLSRSLVPPQPVS